MIFFLFENVDILNLKKFLKWRGFGERVVEIDYWYVCEEKEWLEEK